MGRGLSTGESQARTQPGGGMHPQAAERAASAMHPSRGLTLRRAVRTLAGLLFDPPCACFGEIFRPEPLPKPLIESPHEAYLSTEQSPSSAHPRFSCAHGHSRRASGARPSSRQGSQAPLSLSFSEFVARNLASALTDLHAPARPFTPAHRLKSKSEFDRVYRDARRSADGSFAVFMRGNDNALPRLGLSIAARVIGNSVRRNRVKRLIRESFRLHQHELPSVDIVVNARSGARDADNAALVRSLEKHWRAVIKLCASS
jgi:ribonuclease P protein component